eukprot:5633598-Pyramimonas_sp.AAC.1
MANPDVRPPGRESFSVGLQQRNYGRIPPHLPSLCKATAHAILLQSRHKTTASAMPTRGGATTTTTSENNW